MSAKVGLDVVENIETSFPYQESNHDSLTGHYTAHAYSSSPLNTVLSLRNV
jgi:hypothetical protein